MSANRRSINRKVNTTTNPWASGFLDFPKEKDGIIYVRQSSLIQVQNNIHSFEMQTDKFLEHFRNMGCTGNITIVADDEAMSGTLDIHQRPGMTRIVKMIEDEVVGWVGAVHVNRFTRDKWLITPGVLMKLCHDHNVWISTLRMHFNFKDSYCQRVFMLEAEEAARHLEWMKLVLGGGKSAASDNGYYDGRLLVPGYIVDRTDPKRKKYIIYTPHAEIDFWLFKRFFELDANFPELCREVDSMPYLFPKFESWVDQKNISRFGGRKAQIQEGPYKGYFKPSDSGLMSILTNPVYIGWWLPLDGGVIEHNHEPIVEEWLFTYAHKRLSTYDFNGQRQKPERVIRYGKVEAVLKKVITGETAGTFVYANPCGAPNYRCLRDNGLSQDFLFSIEAERVDSAFLEKFFEHVRCWHGYADWEDQIQQKREAKKEREKLIRKSIREAELKMERITELLADIETPLPDSMKKKYLLDYKGLEAKKKEMERELKGSPEDEDEEIQYQIGTLIPQMITEWDNLAFEKRMRIAGAFTHKVVLSHPSPGWIKMEIAWKLEWGVDIAHLRRISNKTSWSDTEDAIIHELYPTRDAAELLNALPTRTWQGIKVRASDLGVQRVRRVPNRQPVEPFEHCSKEDRAYAREYGLDSTSKNPQWS